MYVYSPLLQNSFLETAKKSIVKRINIIQEVTNMKSFRKITAWAMALAIASTAAAMTTAYAEGEEVPTTVPTEAVTEAPTEAPTIASTEAPTETPTDAPTEVPTAAPTTPAVTGDVSGTVKNIEIRITGNNLYLKDNATGMSINIENNKATIDGTVIEEINFDLTDLTDEEQQLIVRVAEVLNELSISEIVLTDNVTDINTALFDASEVDGCTKITFGKNIKAITADPLGGSSATPTVYGYSGTAAEAYALSSELTFSAIGEVPSTTAPKATTPAKKTTAVKTTAKAATTTAKKTDSPKTGDAGTVTGVLAVAAAAALLSMKKRKHE